MVDSRIADRVRGVRSGEPGAAEALDRLLRPRLLGYFSLGPWPRDEAEDLVQKTLTLVFTHVETLHDVARFVPWLFAIARNVRSSATKNWLTRHQRESVGLEFAADDPPSARAEPLEAGFEREQVAALRAALVQLPPRQRQCLVLQVRDELSYEEIATTLRLSVNTVRNHIAQAKKTLRERLAPEPGESDR